MNTPKRKDQTAVEIGNRIKQARQMAGFKIQKDLNAKMIKKHGWSTGRLGNYEAGQSTPSPSDVLLLSKETKTSACWIMFGAGPIRAGDRDLQAIRHQNLVNMIALLDEQGNDSLDRFYKRCESNADAIKKYTDNPFRVIGARQARRFEKAMSKPDKWLDEQHIEIDPVCSSFPEDLREIMMLYSDMNASDKDKLLTIARLL